MIISIATMYQSPFDNTYANVPDFSALSKYSEMSFGRSLEFWLDNGKKKTVYPTAKSFTPNDREVIYATIKTNETLDYQSYNYCILLCKPDNDTVTSKRYFYFIEDIVLINSLKEATLKITLSKDIWATYMAEIGNYTMPSQKIIRRHVPEFYSAGGDIYSDYTQENIVDKVIETKNEIVLPEIYQNGNDDTIDILWLRLRLDPNIPLYIKVNDEYKLFDSTAVEYGNFKYVFRPLRVYRQNRYQDKIRINGELQFAIGEYVRLPTQDVLISADVTFYPPFYYTCSFDFDDDVVDVTIGDWEERDIYTKTTDYYLYATSGWVADGITPKREYERIYRLEDTEAVLNPNSPNGNIENFNNRQAFKYYPYTKYTLRTPDGSLITFNSPKIIDYLRINFSPTDSSIQYRIHCSAADGTVIIDDEDLRTFAQSTGSIPQSVSNYENFLLTSAYKYSVQYQHSLNSADLRRDREVSASTAGVGQGIGTVVAGAGLMLATGGAMGGSTIAQGGSQIFNSGKNIYFAQREYNLETNYIKDLKQADMQQIKNTISNKPSPSSDLGDWFFQDRFILYKETPVLNDHLRSDMAEFTYFGYNQSIVDNPLKNCRHHYDYVKIEGILKPLSFIANPTHRNIFASILLEGTRKWHIDNYPNNFTDLNLDINGNEFH